MEKVKKKTLKETLLIVGVAIILGIYLGLSDMDDFQIGILVILGLICWSINHNKS